MTSTAGDGGRPALLALCTLPPWPPTNGYSLRVFNLLRELAADWAITLVAPPAADGSPVPCPLAGQIPVALSGTGLTYPWGWDQRPLRDALAGLLREFRPDCALVWPGAESLWFGRHDLPGAVVDMIDCNPLEFWRALGTGSGWRAHWRSGVELALAAWYAHRTVRSFCATTCVGEQDCAWMARIGRRDTVHMIPNGVVLPPEAALVAEAARPTLCFTGTLDYPPNVDAACYTATAIWPRVRAEIAGARLVIAGRAPVAAVTALGNGSDIEIIADAPDLVPILGAAWVAIAPMRIGVGIKNKILEAWSCARPVVMTPRATNGLTLPPGHDALVCRGTAELAAAVVGLLRSGNRQRQGVAAREHVARHFTWQEAASRLSTVLRDCAATRGTQPQATA